MTLFGDLHLGASSLRTNQTALQITGDNIANVNTPGFARQEADIAPIRTNRTGFVTIGDGVRLNGVEQKIDRFLAERARQAGSEFEAASARSTLIRRVEGLFNELTEIDLSTTLDEFFAAVQDVQNNPDDVALRDIVVAHGEFVADTIRSLRSSVDAIRSDASDEVRLGVDDINNILGEIDSLNDSIVAAEAGTTAVDAGSLRTLRDQLITKLSNKIDIQVFEEEKGNVNIFAGGHFLLFDGVIHEVATLETTDRGAVIDTLVFADSQAVVPTGAGRLGGLQTARDQDLASVIDALDQVASALIFEFNQIHSSGQGLRSFSSIESTNRVLNAAVPLNTNSANLPPNPPFPVGAEPANLPFTPTNGAFELRVTDSATGLDRTTVIDVDLDGIGADDSLNDVVTKLNAAFGTAAASVNAQGRLEIQAPPGIEFSFARDTSGFLAAIGVNTFFTGADSRDINVHDRLKTDGAFFAASQNGLPGDVSNAAAMVRFQDDALAALGDESFSDFVLTVIDDVAAVGQTVSATSEFLQANKQSLEAEHLSISAVSLDEEAVKLISFQRSFQASARFIQTINELLDEVLGLVQ